MYLLKGLFIAVVLAYLLTLFGCAGNFFGKSYDCGKMYAVPEREINQAYEWCSVDPSRDFSKNQYGEHRDWRAGNWVR